MNKMNQIIDETAMKTDKILNNTIKPIDAIIANSNWLFNRNSDIDVNFFSDWVTRMTADGMEEEDARNFVYSEVKMYFESKRGKI